MTKPRKKSTVNQLIKSVPNPSAQNAILCSVQEVTEPVILKALYLSSGNSHWPPAMRCIIGLQLYHGLRISEVLSIRAIDLMTLGRIRVNTLKRGQTRIIQYSDNSGYLESCRKNQAHPFKDYNRFFLYRMYMREGIVMFHDKNKKNSVTHALRHALVQQVLSEQKDESLVSDLLGHKSLKTIEHYKKK